MDQNDETLTFSVEPIEEQNASAQADAAASVQAESVSAEPEKKEKNHTGLRLTALLVAVAIVAGLAGSALSHIIDRISEKNAAVQMEADLPKEADETDDGETKQSKQERQKEEEKETEINRLALTPLPQTLKSYSGEKTLTPKQVYALNVNAVVGIATQVTTNVWGQAAVTSCSGSGFVITEDGYIVTNNHVIEDATSVTVKDYEGTEYEATVIGTDSLNDVALLKIEAEGLQSVAFADSDQIEVGEEVVAIGNPFGELTFTMTAGYVSALDRMINTDGRPINMLQTDAAINSGNSGGPLFDMNGNVIGITTAKYSGTTSSGTIVEGIGFAIPINDVTRIIYDLREYGYVKGRAYLGVSLKDLDSSVADTYKLPVGPMIMGVEEGSCSEKAGVQENDIVVGFEGAEIHSYADLLMALGKCRAGDTVTMKVFRGGAEVELKIVLDERPQETESEPEQQLPTQQQEQDLPGYSYTFPFGFGFGW